MGLSNKYKAKEITMTESLLRLRTLTETLPILGPTLVRSEAGGAIDYDCEVGSCIGEALYNVRECAVQHAMLTAGTMFPSHTHNETEVLILFKGKCNSILGVVEEPMVIGHPVVVRPHELHCVRALSDCEMIGVTIPAAEGYPRDESNK